jgi:hypothetical protein
VVEPVEERALGGVQRDVQGDVVAGDDDAVSDIAPDADAAIARGDRNG